MTISAENDATILEDPYTPADTIADFSSRGPLGLTAVLKPDVTAPGVGIFAAKMGSGDEGTSMNGTSMASPHVAGVAALVLQARPDWSPEQVKAVIMNTAVDLAAGSAEVPRQGAGRVDAYRAVTENAFAIGDEDQVSLNWGVIQIEGNSFQDAKSILLHDLSGTSPKAYDVSVVWGENSPEAGVQLTVPMTVEVTTQRRFANLTVGLDINATQVVVAPDQLEEYYGYVVLTSQADPADRLRVPFYLIPQPYSHLSFGNLDFENRSAEIEITQSSWQVPS